MAGSKSGNVMVEFAMIAAPFFLLLGGIVEMAFLMLASNALQSAVQVAGQEIENGVVSADSMTFRGAVCERLPAIMSCEGELVIDVESVSDWGSFQSDQSVTEAFPLDAATNDLFVRVSYAWPTIFPSAVLGMDISDDSGSFLLAATAIIR